ncbi:precorrin-6A reductase [Neisseria sp. Ec49-e6-T10]|uniref:precorrin-6A reductase n=1 Tax=Neisseria sp. Ec49-e6-T10 TaxID=3140744 RepID=UPI003EBAE26F
MSVQNGVFSGKIHVFGGTSDAVLLCQALEALNLAYSLSVATEVGSELATGLKGKIVVARLNPEQMQTYFQEYAIDLVIDATHPFAAEVSRNIAQATDALGLALIRYERQEQIDLVDNPLLIKVTDVESACEAAKAFGSVVFLTTGSKQLADYVRLLPEKTLIARVLPTVDVLRSCAELGLGVGQIVAMKGPFSQQMNEAMYQFYQPDVVITKESGVEGGYTEKILPAIEQNIPCIVIRRPKQHYQHLVSSIEALTSQLLAWKK